MSNSFPVYYLLNSFQWRKREQDDFWINRLFQISLFNFNIRYIIILEKWADKCRCKCLPNNFHWFLRTKAPMKWGKYLTIVQWNGSTLWYLLQSTRLCYVSCTLIAIAIMFYDVTKFFASFVFYQTCGPTLSDNM